MLNVLPLSTTLVWLYFVIKAYISRYIVLDDMCIIDVIFFLLLKVAIFRTWVLHYGSQLFAIMVHTLFAFLNGKKQNKEKQSSQSMLHLTYLHV